MLDTRRRFLSFCAGCAATLLAGCMPGTGESTPVAANRPQTPAATVGAAPTPVQSPAVARSAPPGVSEARFARLARGINTSSWFSQTGSYTSSHFKSYVTADDIKLIKSAGFTHIRFPMNPFSIVGESLFDPNDPATLDVRFLRDMDAALDMMLEQGLAVIVDIHPEDDFKQRLASDDKAVADFATFWKSLAAHLAQRDPEQLFLEILNEPVIPDLARWTAIQKQVLTAMRVGAPQHSLIATAHKWSSIDELVQLEPVADANVIYNFHDYEPHIFTHQGATWGSEEWKYVDHLPYPSSPQAVAPALDTIKNASARQAVIQYGAQNWNAARIDTLIARAASWANQYNVRLTCNEFGVYRLRAAPEDRNAWIHDTRVALEKYHIGWAMWDYAGGFSVVTNQSSTRAMDPATLQALGLG